MNELLTSKCAIDLFNTTGERVATFSGRASERSYTKSRNEADTIKWSVNLNEFENYCRINNVDSTTLLVPYKTVVAVRYGSDYLAAGLYIYDNASLTQQSQMLSVEAWGWLNILQRRSITYTYNTPMDASLVFADVLERLQSMTNGDLGLTIGHTETVGTLSQKTYDGTKGKDALQNLSRLQVAAFDFRFNKDKTVDIYKQIGSNRPDVIFTYPGNIISMDAPKDSTNIINHVTAIGSGTGDVAISATSEDTVSQIDYTYLDDNILSNAQIEVDEVQEDADSYISAHKDPLVTPQPVVNLNGNIKITDFDIGDRIQIRVKGFPRYADMNRTYRVERIEANFDKNDRVTARLYLS